MGKHEKFLTLSFNYTPVAVFLWLANVSRNFSNGYYKPVRDVRPCCDTPLGNGSKGILWH